MKRKIRGDRRRVTIIEYQGCFMLIILLLNELYSLFNSINSIIVYGH